MSSLHDRLVDDLSAEFARCRDRWESLRLLRDILARHRPCGHPADWNRPVTPGCEYCKLLDDIARFRHQVRRWEFAQQCAHTDVRPSGICPACGATLSYSPSSASRVTCEDVVTGERGWQKKTAPTAPTAPLIVIRAVVTLAGGRLALTPAEWAARLNLEVSARDDPTVPGSRALSFSRWFLNDIAPEAWAAAGLAYRRKIVHGRRLVEITAEERTEDKT